MASVTGRTAESIDAILAKMVTSVRVDSGQLIYKHKDGTETNGGPITSPAAVVDKAWPIGSIYVGVSSANPADLLGVGTWVRYAEGKVLVSQDEGDADFGIAGDTGGEKKHALTVNEMPAHKHDVTVVASKVKADMAITDRDTPAQSPSSELALDAGINTDNSYNIAGSSHTHAVTEVNRGSNHPHNNLQPYMVVFMWRRTG